MSRDIKVISLGRQEGKTTALLEWMREAPEGENRILVSHSSEEAMRVYRSTFDHDNRSEFYSWQFVGWDEVTGNAWSAIRGEIVLGIDNLDLILQKMTRWRVRVITINEGSRSPAG